MAGTERSAFQRLLFRTAFCVMACDGEIEDREVAEIRSMNENAAYFKGIDLTEELKGLLADLKEKGKLIVNDLFETVTSLQLSTVQELLVLEVAFRLADADRRTDESEVRFLRLLRTKLQLHDQTILDRFGPIEYLFDSDYASMVVRAKVDKDATSSFRLPDESQLSKIDFTIESTE